MTSPVAVIGLVWDGHDLARPDLNIFFDLAEGLDTLPEVRGADQLIPFRAGRLPGLRLPHRRPIVANGHITGPADSTARAAFRAYVDEVKGWMDPTIGERILVATLEDGSTRWITCAARNILPGDAQIAEYRAMSLEWEAVSDPLWHVSVDTIEAAPNADPYYLTITAEGTAVTTGLRVEVDEAASGVSVVNVTRPSTQPGFSRAAFSTGTTAADIIGTADGTLQGSPTAGASSILSWPVHDIVCVGDSLTNGISSYALADRWIEKIQATLRTAHPSGAAGGVGYRPSSAYGAWGDWSRAGSSTAYYTIGLGLQGELMTAACTFSITETCTGIDILWCGTGNPGHFRWRIDGGAWTDVNQQVDNYGGRVTPIRGLSAASHTLDVDWVSGVALLEGAMIYNGDEETGVRVWNGARGGAQTVTFSAGGTWWLDSLATVAPELVTIMLGVNDYANNIAVATFSARLQTIITNVRVTVPTAQILLVAPYQAYVAAPAAPWSDYVAAMEAICQADPSVLFTSLVGVFGGYTDPPVGGSALIAADRVHPTPAGHTLIASEIDKAITIAIARGLLDLSIVAGDTGTTFATASNQRVSLPDLAALQFGDTFSISMWVKRASIGTIQRFWTHDAVNGLAFYCKADNTVECQKVGVGSYLVSILPFDDLSTWHHILVTKGGVTSGDAQVYLDRAPMRRTFANQTITNPVGSRYIGYTSQSWDGGIAAVAVFNRVLTTAERMRLGTARTAETQRTAAEDLGASAYYPLGRKTLAVDSGLRVVTLDGVQDRGNLTLASDNEHGEYLRLWRGRNTIRVTGQPTTVRIRRDETYL